MFLTKNGRLIWLFFCEINSGTNQMKKISATKMKMTQLWKDNAMIGVAPLKLVQLSDADELKAGDTVKVSGNIKGHGFQGVVKRYSFAGGPKTHGQKNRYRAGGSIGSTAPQRVLPGRKNIRPAVQCRPFYTYSIPLRKYRSSRRSVRRPYSPFLYS